MLPEENNQPLHLYWKEKVIVKRESISKAKHHIKAQKLRHEYTNYDQLIKSIELQRIEPLERSRRIAIIKYECTSQALQCVNGFIRDQLIEAKKASAKSEADVIRRDGIIAAIQKLLWGNEKEIKNLKDKLHEQDIEIRSLKEKLEQQNTEDEYLAEIKSLQNKLEDEQRHRLRLAKNNQRLGGKVSSYKQIKAQLEEFRDLYGSKKAKDTPLFQELENTKRELMNRERLLSEYKVLKRKLSEDIQTLQKQVQALQKELLKKNG